MSIRSKKDTSTPSVLQQLSTTNRENRKTIVANKLSTGDTEIKRIDKNAFIQNPEIQETFQNFIASLNQDASNNDLAYLIKGSSAWYANFFLAQDRDLNVQTEIGDNVGFLPQNWDMEIYTKESQIETMFCKYYNLLLGYHRELIDSQDENYETCVSFSKNVKMYHNEKKGKKKGRLIPNACALTKETRKNKEKVQNKKTCTNIELKDSIGFENFRAYQLRFCVRIKNNKNEDAWNKFNDKDVCEVAANFHLIFYITFHVIPDDRFLDFKTRFFSHITREINGAIYLNHSGLLFYSTFIRANSGREFRKDKGIDLDNYRLEKLIDTITQTRVVNDQQKRQRAERVIEQYNRLYHLVNSFFEDQVFWKQYLIPSDYWFGNIKQELVKTMLKNYWSPTIPNGIVQKLDDIFIDYYRPILNAIVVELANIINSGNKDSPLTKKFPNVTFKVMIAGGDAFERYIPTNKIADIDLKIIMQPKTDADKEYKDEIILYVRQLIFAILSKHIVILNKMVEECANDDVMFQSAMKQSAEKIITKNCDSDSLFKLCAKINPETGTEFKTNFRLRNLPIYKSNLFTFNLVSIDMRKSFQVFYNDKKDPLSFKYDLAILDVPFKFYEGFDERKDIDLQETINFPVTVGRECFTNSPVEVLDDTEKTVKKAEVQELLPLPKLDVSRISTDKKEIKGVKGKGLGQKAPSSYSRQTAPSLCADKKIKQPIKADGICFYRSILFCMTQLTDETKKILVSNFNSMAPHYEYKLSLNEIQYNVNDENNKNTIKTCCKMGFVIYYYLVTIYDKETNSFYDKNSPEITDFISNILEVSPDYDHPYFYDRQKFSENNYIKFLRGVATGSIRFNNNLVDNNNNPLEWAGQLDVYLLSKIFNVSIDTMPQNPFVSRDIVLYVCYNGRNHYNGVKIGGLPLNFQKIGYKVGTFPAELVEFTESKEIPRVTESKVEDEEFEEDVFKDFATRLREFLPPRTQEMPPKDEKFMLPYEKLIEEPSINLRKIKDNTEPIVKKQKIIHKRIKIKTPQKRAKTFYLYDPITNKSKSKTIFRFDDDLQLPIASVEFLIKDQEYMYNDVGQLQQRFWAGKIEKDINRYINLKDFIKDKKTVSREQVQKLNKIDYNYYNFAVLNETKFTEELNLEIFAYFVEALSQFEDTKMKSSVERNFNFERKYNYMYTGLTLLWKNFEYDFTLYNIVDFVNDNFNFIEGMAKFIKSTKPQIKSSFNFEIDEDDQENEFEPANFFLDDIEYII